MDRVAEYKNAYKKYNAPLKAGEKHPIEKTGAKLRAFMPWIQKKESQRRAGRLLSGARPSHPFIERAGRK